MQKGQAFALTNDAFIFPHGASFVLVPFGEQGVLPELVEPAFDSTLVSGGNLSPSLLEEKNIVKVIVVSKSDFENVSFSFNNSTTAVSPEVKDEMKTWVSFSIYQHNGSWKVRFIDETISGNDMLLRYLKIGDYLDLTTPCNKEYRPLDSLRSQAKATIGSQDSSQTKKNASKLAKSLASEGMSIFRRLKGKASNAANQVKNKKFLDAVCAVGAIVAYSDGYASPTELEKLTSIIRNDEDLKVFHQDEITASFEKLVGAMKLDNIVGEGKAMASISVFANKPEANALLAFGLGVAMAEGGVDNDERNAIERIANTLQISAEDLLGRVE